MNLKRLISLGVAVWLVPFVASVFLFGVRGENRALFESLITVIGVASAVVATHWYFRAAPCGGVWHGVMLGFAWAAISVLIDLPIFLAGFEMGVADYLSDIAVTYLAFPVITTGIALAIRSNGRGA